MIADSSLGLEMQVIAGEAGLDRQILHTRIQKSGLALAGHYHGIVPSRVQILGQTELSFLQRLSTDGRVRSLRGFLGLDLCCVILTTGAAPLPVMDPNLTTTCADGRVVLHEASTGVALLVPAITLGVLAGRQNRRDAAVAELDVHRRRPTLALTPQPLRGGGGVGLRLRF